MTGDVDPPPSDLRRVELLDALAAVRGRLTAAASSVGRDPRAITLVAVTKTFPASDCATLLALGIFDLGESRDQEAREKIDALGADAGTDGAGVRWHFVGRLQTNKCRSVARYAHAVHSVDRPELVSALADGAVRAGRSLEIFVQLSLDGDPARGGVAGDALVRLADTVAAVDGLRLAGLMTVPPLGTDPAAAYAAAAEASAALVAGHPSATGISAGMSEDFEIAVRKGSTHVRVGSALLGRRERFVS